MGSSTTKRCVNLTPKRVNLTRNRWRHLSTSAVFQAKNDLASTLLKRFSNVLTVPVNPKRITACSDKKPNQKPVELYEKPPQKNGGLHLDRVVGRHRYYRHSGGHVAAGAGPRQSARATHQLCEQPQASRLGVPHLCPGQPGPVPDAGASH